MNDKVTLYLVLLLVPSRVYSVEIFIVMVVHVCRSTRRDVSNSVNHFVMLDKMLSPLFYTLFVLSQYKEVHQIMSCIVLSH